MIQKHTEQEWLKLIQDCRHSSMTVKDWCSQHDLNLPRETMANWYIRCAQEYFYPVYERMHELLLKRDIIHADETVCQVLR